MDIAVRARADEIPAREERKAQALADIQDSLKLLLIPGGPGAIGLLAGEDERRGRVGKLAVRKRFAAARPRPPIAEIHRSLGIGLERPVDDQATAFTEAVWFRVMEAQAFEDAVVVGAIEAAERGGVVDDQRLADPTCEGDQSVQLPEEAERICRHDTVIAVLVDTGQVDQAGPIAIQDLCPLEWADRGRLESVG